MTLITRSQIIEFAISHLNGQFSTHQVGEDFHVITPFMNADQAPIELFVKPVGNEYKLTDEQETVNQLFINGVSAGKNPELIQQIVKIAHNYRVEFRDSELFVKSSQEEIGESIQNLAGAIQAVSLFFLNYQKRNPARF